MQSLKDPLENDQARRHTSARAALIVDEKTRNNIRYYAAQPRQRLDARIAELERERDLEQLLETNVGILALMGAVLGTTVHRRFFILTGAVLSFLAQHACSGWCPPVPVFRSLGARTRAEIDQEKFALKALRGDFGALPADNDDASIERVLDAVIA